jgi:hypothetical protein
MACLLTGGRTEPCSDAIGGLKAIYLLDYLEDSFTVANSEATAIDAAVTVVYKYELLADGNTFNEPFTQDINAGTSIYEQSLAVALKKQTLLSARELALVVKSRPVVVVQDRMDNYKIMGISDGTAVTGDIVSGGAKGEFNGYNITFTATETDPAPFLDSATVTALLALVGGTDVTP